MTTHLQRMHQDEWLASLRCAAEQGRGLRSMRVEPRCALGRVIALAGAEERDWPDQIARYLGISVCVIDQLWRRNDGVPIKLRGNPNAPYDGPAQSFDEIADWFKAERDEYDGDLSCWPERAS